MRRCHCKLFLRTCHTFKDHLFIKEIVFSEEDMLATVAKFKSHIDGTLSLSKAEMFDELQVFFFNSKLLQENCKCLGAALDLVKKFEDIHGALFINSKTQGGINRDWAKNDNLELERSVLYIQQTLVDEVYQEQLPYDDAVMSPLQNCDDKLTGHKWETSNFFPGYMDPPDDSFVEYSIQIDATMPPFWGMKACSADEPILRTTGLYLSPGGIAIVEVSSDLVNSNYKIQVGASVTDNSNKSKHLRMDRVTSTYAIKDIISYIANPLGGGIYVKVPYSAELGVVTIKITGDVIRAPIFAMTSIRSTSATEWNDDLRHSPAPWADFETDLFLMQVPTSWIKAYDHEHCKTLLEGNDDALTSVSELVGVPIEKRNKHVLYVQPDLHIKSFSFTMGYPQVNILMESGPNGPTTNPSHFLVAKPYLDWYVTWHELGHCIIRGNQYRGETEAIINFPFTNVRNVHMSEDFDSSFSNSRGGGEFTPDNAAVDWMVTENFRNGEEMDYSNKPGDQFKYQYRGYAKYADVVRLFSWRTLADFNYEYNDNYKNPIDHGLEKTDDRTLRLSIATGVDLSPLIHFWDIHPVKEDNLRNKMIEYDLPLSSEVYNLLIRYLTLIPMDNAEFIDFFDIVYPGKYGSNNCASPLFGCGWDNEWANKYDDSHNTKAVITGNAVVDKYYSCEDTLGEFIVNGTTVTCGDLLTEDFDWACNHRQYTDLCPSSCEICGDVAPSTPRPHSSTPTKSSPTSNPTVSPTMNPTTSSPTTQTPTTSTPTKSNPTTSSPTKSTPTTSSPTTTSPTTSTPSPVNPTKSPVNPTPSPVNPTPSPVNPTKSPVNPTKSPVNPTPSPVNPTPSPVEVGGCEEAGKTKWLFKIKPDGVKTKNCEWLKKKNSKRITKLCRSKESNTEFGTPKQACPITCYTCGDTCDDDQDATFVFGLKKNGEALYKNCGWLKKKMTRKKKQGIKICKNKTAPPSPAKVCPITCAAC